MRERTEERRRSRRIDVALPVILENATGVTRDVSASGVFFWKRGTFVYGESIHFSMERKTESGRVVQKCRGVVVRTEPRGSDIGVAARITNSTTEPVPGRLSGTDSLKSACEQPRNITRRPDDALASAMETVNRWSSLLRNKALEAREELQGQEVLKWEIAATADAITPYSQRVTVCSVTVLGLGSNKPRSLWHGGIPGASDRDVEPLHSDGEINARKKLSDAGAGGKSEFVNSRNLHDGCSVRIELEVYVANASRADPTPDKTPLPKVVVRTRSVRDDDRHQELDQNCHQQKSYTDPTQAFEAFLALAVESAILINLEEYRVNS